MNRSRGPHPDELVSAAVSGDLTPAERVELDAHLATCPICQADLAAQAEARRLLASAPAPSAPTDLAARVERAAARSPWARPVRIGASLATVVGAIALVVVVSHNVGLPAASQEPSASLSVEPTSKGSAEPTGSPSDEPVPSFLGPGNLGYLVLSGGGFEEFKFGFVNAQTGVELPITPAPSGAVIAASLSADGRFLAYITVKGESGYDEVWAVDLSSGSAQSLGCTLPGIFSDRLSWSADSKALAYTLISGQTADEDALGCSPNLRSGSDGAVWVVTPGGEPAQFSESGTYAAGFDLVERPYLWVSHLAEQPWSQQGWHSEDVGLEEPPYPGVFMPLREPGGTHFLFYQPVLARDGTTGEWTLQGGGIPLVGSKADGGFTGTQTIDPGTAGSTLVPWQTAWSANGDAFVVWASAWATLWVGHASTPDPSDAVEVSLDLPLDDGWVEDVALSPDGSAVYVTVGIPSAGIGDPPSSIIIRYDLTNGDRQVISVDPENLPWVGPVVFGTE